MIFTPHLSFIQPLLSPFHEAASVSARVHSCRQTQGKDHYLAAAGVRSEATGTKLLTNNCSSALLPQGGMGADLHPSRRKSGAVWGPRAFGRAVVFYTLPSEGFQISLPHANPWSALPQSWCSIELPGYREFWGTYGTFPADELPPTRIALDDECAWLAEHGARHTDGLNKYQRGIEPQRVIEMAKGAGFELPNSFIRFMSSPDLQSRVRSCTACYLNPGDRIVQTIGGMPGHLACFLSDSQGCVHWYLHVLADGRSAVIESEDLFCHNIENSSWAEYPYARLERIDVAKQDFRCCALSFSEFLYRFWIENEIWFALAYDKTRRPLTLLEAEYVGHYAKQS